MKWAAVIGVASCVACTQASKPAPVDSSWHAVAGKDVFAAGGLRVYVRTAKRDTQLGLPGVAFGDERGPRFGLLGGYYAPWILAPTSSVAYSATTKIADGVLHIRMTAKGARGLDVSVASPKHGRATVLVNGSVVLSPRANRTALRGFFETKPSFAFEVTAGTDSELVSPRADVVEIDVEENDTWRIDSACPRVRILRPRRTGSTSVFLVAVGPAALLHDDVYTVDGADARHEDLDRCDGTATSTFTFAWP